MEVNLATFFCEEDLSSAKLCPIRSRDKNIIDKTLLQEAISKLKKLPYECNDPTDSVAKELVLEAYRLGHFRYEDLTDTGCQLARQEKYRGHQQLKTQRIFHGQTSRNCYLLRAV